MKIYLFPIILSIYSLAVFSSCESLFTTSFAEWAERDPSQMTKSQKINYAEDALSSGDRDSMKEAYDALKDTTDPNLQPLVAELAIGAAGVPDALSTVLGKVAAGSTEAIIESALQDAFTEFNTEELALIREAATLIQSAERGGADITADQYFITGVGLLVVALDAANGDVTRINTTTGSGRLAIDFLTKVRDQFPPASEAAKLINAFRGYF